MQILLIGPYPPPHGGISVHVAQARRLLKQEGHDCRVLNLHRGSAPSAEYISVRSAWDLLSIVWDCGKRKWIVHCHINGHNLRSWLVAWLCGFAGFRSPARLLTIHSGLAPAYLEHENGGSRFLAWLTCSLYHRIICVSPEVEEAVHSLGISQKRLDLLPAFLPGSHERVELPVWLQEWISSHRPLLCTALCFLPEYGFGNLVEALEVLRHRFPRLGCLVLGGGAQAEEGRSLVRKHGLEDVTALLGDVDHDLALTLMARSHLFVRATLKDGDAVSVREALSLGVPVVATNVGMRPQGTVLCRPGDPADLVSKIVAVLSERRDEAQTLSVPSPEGFRQLLQIYRRLAPPHSGVERSVPPSPHTGIRLGVRR